MTTGKSMLKSIVSGCVVRSEHIIEILNAKSIGKEHLNVEVQKFKRRHQRLSIKKVALKNSAIFIAKHLYESLF